MFILQFPVQDPQTDQIEAFFKDYSLAHRVEAGENQKEPTILDGKKKYEGLAEINKLIAELKNYYGQNYNCSCAR